MRIFVTGATGWVGTGVVRACVSAGHEVFGLVRQAQHEQALASLKVTPVRGSLDTLDVLEREASQAEAVIHTAFHHDFTKFLDSAAQDKRAIEAMGQALRPHARLIATSGLIGIAQGRAAVESDEAPASFPRQSEAAIRALRSAHKQASLIRLPPSVHGEGDLHGFVPFLIGLAKRTGVAAYLGDGANLWSSVHRDDAATLYRLAAEAKEAHPVLHAVSAKRISFKDLAGQIGKMLHVPVEARPKAHFEWMGMFAGADAYGSAEKTQQALGWKARGPSLAEDLERGSYAQLA